MSEPTQNEKDPLPAPAAPQEPGGSFEAEGPIEISPEELAEC